MATASLPQGPVSNKAAKQDKLAVAATFALASFGAAAGHVTLSEPLRQAYASTAPADMVPPPIAAPQARAEAEARRQAAAASSAKSYALLSDAQIAGIKERLKLSSSQESYWPAVETALRAIARKIHATPQVRSAAP